jgi:pimeloyl-ACP methyl ester carboxylesterase
MDYPIVKVRTKDKLILNGLLIENAGNDKIVINIHGSASNFYEEQFFEHMATVFPKKGFSWLSINNRGNSALTHTWQKVGSTVERFEDCIIDIDAWIEFAINKRYSTIILQGHSLGTEKIVYYMNKGKYKSKVSGIILLGYSDSYNATHKFIDGLNCKEKLFAEANNLIKNKKENQFLTTIWYCHAGVLPKSAESFVNHFSNNSELSKALPLQSKKLDMYSKIEVPILAILSDKDKWTDTKSVELLKKSNIRTRTAIIHNTNHDFKGKEEELTKIVTNFLVSNFK